MVPNNLTLPYEMSHFGLLFDKTNWKIYMFGGHIDFTGRIDEIYVANVINDSNASYTTTTLTTNIPTAIPSFTRTIMPTFNPTIQQYYNSSDGTNTPVSIPTDIPSFQTSINHNPEFSTQSACMFPLYIIKRTNSVVDA